MENQLKPGKLLKSKMLEEYTKRLKGCTTIFVTGFGGLTNREIESLRKKLKASAVKYLVVKNSLCKAALKDLKKDKLADMLEGFCGLTYGSGDPVSISKALVDYAKANEKLKLKGAYIDGEMVTAATIKELAALPSREVLLTRLVSAMNSPVSGFVSVCSGMIRKFVYALAEVARKKDGK